MLNPQIEHPLLTLEESWELLRRKASSIDIVSDHGYRQEIEKLGKEMAKRCQALPLAVAVLGSLLKTKNSLDQWTKVLRDVNSHLNKLQLQQSYGGVQEILAFSYHDLPYNLKSCFLHIYMELP